MRRQFQRRFKQGRRIIIVANQRAKQAHLFFDQRAFIAVRKHRVEIYNLRRLSRPRPHQRYRIAPQQAHRCDDFSHRRVAQGTLQPVFKQGGNHRPTLDHRHRTTQFGEDESITTETGGRIKQQRSHAGLDTDCLGDHLPAAAAKQATMRHRTRDKIDAHRAGCLLAQIQQLQTIRPQLQGEIGLAIFRQLQAPRPISGGLQKLRRDSFNSNSDRIHEMINKVKMWPGGMQTPLRKARILHLFIDISSHGLGHLAISAPLLNALQKIRPNLRLTVRSAVPPAKLRQRIAIDFDLIEAASDFGYVMIDATRIDHAASAAAYRRAHADWPARVAEESGFLTALKLDLVLTNVSYLPLAAAAQLGIPSMSLCSLNWADLFEHFFGGEVWADKIHHEILDAYRAAQKFLCVTPGMAMPALANRHEIGTIAAIGKKHDLGLGDNKAILIAMGGIAHRLPVEHWPRLPGIRWLLPTEWQCTHPDALPLESFALSFSDLLCSVDAVITKPGYGTFTEAACNGTPVIYQRRADWPEQDCLIEWLNNNARCREIDEPALQRGDLESTLCELLALPQHPTPPADGIAQAVQLILHAAIA